MTEQKAIELAVECWEKRVVPPETRELTETAAIQTIAMLYLKGFEVVPVFRPNVTSGDIEQMRIDGVAY